jgi:hypothetical protein
VGRGPAGAPASPDGVTCQDRFGRGAEVPLGRLKKGPRKAGKASRDRRGDVAGPKELQHVVGEA